MFKNAAELMELAESDGISISEVMIRQEVEVTNQTRESVIERMRKNLDVMKVVRERGTKEDIKSVSGLTGGDAKLLEEYIATGKSLGGDSLLHSVSKAMATNEVNAAMGTICATPTAGASGVVPVFLFGMKDKLQPTDD